MAKTKNPALGWIFKVKTKAFYSPSKKLLSCSEREG